MSTKLEKQVSLPSGNSTIPHQATAQKILLETTTNNLDNTTTSNNNNEMDTILINNSSNNNITNMDNNVNNNNGNNTNTIINDDSIDSKDEVDFIRTKTYPPPTLITSKNGNNNKLVTTNHQQKDSNNQKCSIMKKLTSTNMSNLYNDCEVKSSLKSSLSTLEKFSFFTLGRNNKINHHHINNQQNNHQQQQMSNNNNNNLTNINLNNETNNDIGGNLNNSSSTKNKQQHSTLKKSNSDQQMSVSIKQKFGKSASIARLLGHTYNTKKVENELLKYKNNSNNNSEASSTTCNNTNATKSEQKLLKKNILTNFGNNSNYNNNRNIERFQMCSNNEDDLTATTTTMNSTNLHANNNNNNSNNYNTSTSYNNYNTKMKTKLNQTKQNSINNNSNCNNNCINSQNENHHINNKDNSNLYENKSHYNNNNCNNCNNINNDKNNNKTQITNNSINNGNKEVNIQDFQEDHYNDISAKAFRTISRSLGKLWWKRTHSVEISAPDPEYKVSYLGNVLTGWAKGDGCVEKPLNTLWRNYSQNHKPDVIMRVRVCASGLKATTRQHGLTEYWANRITHCCSPKNYPKVFCWIYRHEGRKLKHELRCHAILCSKESIAQEICNTLRENLDRALHDFKREKILKQNARLSLANSVYENPSLPRRKILLSVGGNNYRPPMERSKSAPKLMAIEEAIGEEDGEETEQTNEPEMPSCCQKDSLYPAMTLGRRRCRRGHSIRRTGKAYKIGAPFCDNDKMVISSNNNCLNVIGDRNKDLCKLNKDDKNILDNEIYLRKYNCHNESNNEDHNNGIKSKSTTSLGSDDDDLEKLLSHNNYDTSSPLAGELLSYFDMKLNAKTSSLTNLSESINNDDDDDNLPNNFINGNDNSNGSNSSDDQILYEASLTTDPCPRPRATLSLENLDNCCDGCESDCNVHIDFDDEEDELYYRQTAILNLLHRNSMRKLANLSMSSDDSGDSIEKSNHHHHHHHHHRDSDADFKHQQHNMDSDEGSISSGCETASTVTANCEDTSLKYINDDKQQIPNVSDELSTSINNNQGQDSLSNDNEITEVKISNKTLTFKRANHSKSPKFTSNHYLNDCSESTNIGQANHEISNYHSKKNFSSRKTTAMATNGSGDISDSEFSDESGYVEFQDQFVPKNKSENDYHNNNNLSLSTSSASSTSSSAASMITTTNQYNSNNCSSKN